VAPETRTGTGIEDMTKQHRDSTMAIRHQDGTDNRRLCLSISCLLAFLPSPFRVSLQHNRRLLHACAKRRQLFPTVQIRCGGRLTPICKGDTSTPAWLGTTPTRIQLHNAGIQESNHSNIFCEPNRKFSHHRVREQTASWQKHATKTKVQSSHSYNTRY
jgi:hypothetical protein